MRATAHRPLAGNVLVAALALTAAGACGHAVERGAPPPPSVATVPGASPVRDGANTAAVSPPAVPACPTLDRFASLLAIAVTLSWGADPTADPTSDVASLREAVAALRAGLPVEHHAALDRWASAVEADALEARVADPADPVAFGLRPRHVDAPEVRAAGATLDAAVRERCGIAGPPPG